MNTSLQTKLRLIYFPYLVVSAGLVCVYTFLNWLLFTRLHLFLLKEEIRNLWIPMGLPWIPLFFWVRPRIKLLKFKNTTRDPVSAVIMLLAFACAVPTIIAQEYLATASGKLTALDNVNAFSGAERTRYYTFGEYFIDRAYHGSHLKEVVTGKGSQYLDLSFYIVCPLYDPEMLPPGDDKHYPLYDHPLYLLDGSPIDSTVLQKINPKKIKSVSVFKGIPAISLYGLAGKYGVVLARTKNPEHGLGPGSGLDLDSAARLPDSIPVSAGNEEATKITPIDPLDSQASGQDDDSPSPQAWIAVRYSKQISNRLTKEAEWQQINDFRYASWLDYFQRPEKGYTYFDELPYNDDVQAFEKVVENTTRFKPGLPIRLLQPQSQPFENRNGSKLPWIFGSFAIGALVYFLILLAIPLEEEKVNVRRSGHREPENAVDAGDSWKTLLPHKGFVATPVIIYVNLAVFIAMVIAGLGFIDFSSKDLVVWGGNFGPLVSTGQWWRLLTGIFLHGGLMHVLLNMGALLFVGLFLEPILGRNRFVVCYLITGLVASIASLKMHPNVVGVGASGAIFGMYGVFLAFLLRGVFPPGMKKAFLASTLIFIGYNLIVGLSGNADNAAHIGGLISGLLIGLALSTSVKTETETKAETEAETNASG